ncbi:aminoglycoside adenylyltransferase family protein [Streptomyces sp. NPDC046853]|uniref:aminoglycoside adenylyltransferase family protein n=1 Tax=Streptomyces sp. NPDC046853 TaxID=3154920 RepID=UPI003406E65A
MIRTFTAAIGLPYDITAPYAIAPPSRESSVSRENSVTQTEDTVRLVRETLGGNVIGVYLYGSACLGGLRPHSDIDVFAVVERPLTAAQRGRLVEGLLGLSVWPARAEGARPVELTIVVRRDVVPWTCPPRQEFQYGEWLRQEYERGLLPSPVPSHDLAPLITMVLLADTPLAGPPPGEVLAPVPAGDLAGAIVAGVPELLAELASDTRNVVLTLARIWMTLATGAITSKDAAADWALARLPRDHRPVLAHARAAYVAGEAGEGEEGAERAERAEGERWAELGPRVGPFAAFVVGEIEALGGASSA